MDRPDIITPRTYQDDRGYVYCALDNMDTRGIKRTYLVENHKSGMIRAWHGHRKAGTYMHVLTGAVKLAAMNIENKEDVCIATISARKPEIFYVPPGYYNGAMSLTDGTKILVYSTLSFNEVKDDDVRLDSSVRDDIWRVVNR